MGLSAFMSNPAVTNSLALMQHMGRQSEFPQAGQAGGPLPALQAGQYAMTPHMLLQPPHGGYPPINSFLPPGMAEKVAATPCLLLLLVCTVLCSLVACYSHGSPAAKHACPKLAMQSSRVDGSVPWTAWASIS